MPLHVYPRLILAAVLTLLLLGCITDASYRLVVENHSNHKIVAEVVYSSYTFLQVEPCTIGFKSYVPGPFYGQRFDVALRDEQGSILQTYPLVGRKSEERRTPLLAIRYPSGQETDCPEVIYDTYELVVNNNTGEHIKVQFQGKDIGMWGLGESRKIGPFKGSVYEAPLIQVISPEGANRVGKDLWIPTEIHNRMGEMPTIEVTVTTSTMR